MMRRRDPRRELARKISGAKLKEPPELCGRCVWAMKESGRPAGHAAGDESTPPCSRFPCPFLCAVNAF